MFVTLLGIVTLLKLLHIANACSPIEVTHEPISAVVMLEYGVLCALVVPDVNALELSHAAL